LIGLYGSIADLTRSVAGLGINSSGVRQIAESVGSGDEDRIACTVKTLRRVALCSGALGALLLVLLSKPISIFTFGNANHTGAVALLALVAFMGDISGAQMALVQGMRRIADLARMNILGALYGTAFSIAIVYFWKEQGLVPSLICVAAMAIVTSWWYARKIKIKPVHVTFESVRQEAAELVKLGSAFMVGGLATVACAYLVRAILVRQIGTEAAGHYQAAWTLGGFYIGFILQAMGADFYPRLTAVANNHPECNRLVNEQAEVGLLIAGPGLLATLTFAPIVIALFYSKEFAPAADILRWICVGMLLQVITWPMGFIVVAKGKRKIFFWTELITNTCYAGLVWLCVKFFGLLGSGIAFFILYLFHSAAVYFIARHLTGFSWSAANRQLAFLFAPLVAVVFAGWYLLRPVPAAVLGIVVTVPVAIYSAKTLLRLIPFERLPRMARKVIRLLRLAPADPECTVAVSERNHT
jgi:PST family polysaccharide transporter